MRHELKILPAFFEPVCLGYKTFEIRKNDRNFHVGDELILREWDGEKYTGNQVHRYVSYILYEWQDSLKDGYCVMSLKSMPSAQPEPLTDIEQRKRGEWDMFELITSAWYGKQYYFMDDNGLAYSRVSHKTMPVQDAINEFMKEISE